MKTYIELSLTALLAVLIYEKPKSLIYFAHHTLGKLVLIGMVFIMAKYYGINAGIIASLITIVLFEHIREDFKNAKKKSSQKEGFAIINGKNEKNNYEISKTDILGLDRDLKMNAIRSFNSSSQEYRQCGKSNPFPK
tara:strand:+ start:246 stop:656 length:411 start_codon:yes stop_codon:yes gene_type:complete